MLRRRPNTIKLIVGTEAENEDLGKKVAEITVGSTTVPIFHSPTRIKVRKPAPEPNGDSAGGADFQYKTYDSFILTYYEGSIRHTGRRNNLRKRESSPRKSPRG